MYKHSALNSADTVGIHTVGIVSLSFISLRPYLSSNIISFSLTPPSFSLLGLSAFFKMLFFMLWFPYYF